MSNETRDMLHENMLNIRDRLTDVVECIREGRPYTDDDLPDGYEWDGDVLLDAEGDEVDHEDVPDIDWSDAADYLMEYPLEIVDERGRNFAVVLSTGGPYIEIEAEGNDRAALHGYWGGEHVTLSGQVFDDVLDWFIDRD